MKPKFTYINPKDLPVKPEPGMYYFIGGRGSGKSLAQLNHMKAITTLYDDIEACNEELAKIERRNNEEKNNCTN
jgi:hypothetical protein